MLLAQLAALDPVVEGLRFEAAVTRGRPHRYQNRFLSHRLELVEFANELEPRARQRPENSARAAIDEQTVAIDYFGGMV